MIVSRISGKHLAQQAIRGNYVGIPYSKLDCQGFVEEVLKDCGVRKPDGTPYNWRGSNSMFRNHIRWRGTIEECQKKFGSIPQGAFVFLVKHDGDEQPKGYHDDLGNASHVGLMDMIDYSTSPEPPPDPDRKEALRAIGIIRNNSSTDTECLDALETLTKYLKEV